MIARFTLTALFVLGLAATALAVEVQLEYQDYGKSTHAEFWPHGVAYAQPLLDLPDGEWKLPTIVSELPVYGLLELYGTKRLILLDKKEAADAFPSILYVDKNGNGDLTDDIRLEGRFSGDETYGFAQYGELAFTLEEDGVSVPYAMLASAQCQGNFDSGEALTRDELESFLSIQFTVRCAYHGKFRIDGQSYVVWLGDANGNGRFDERVSMSNAQLSDQTRLFCQGDQIYVSATPKADYYDGQPLSDLLVIGDRVFDVAVDIPGGKMTLTPTELPLVHVKLATEAERLTLYSEQDNRSIAMFQPGKRTMVPAGDYQVLGYQILRNDEQGDLWRVVASATTAASAITVAGRATTIEFGEPFVPTVAVPSAARALVANGKANDVPMSLNTVGCANAQVVDIGRIRGENTKLPLSPLYAQRPKEATYRILEPDDRVVAQGQFEYG